MGLIPHARPPSGWMVVYVTNSSPDAYIVVGRLETEGVKSWVYQESAGSALGVTVGALGAVQVLVNPEDYERASSILEVDYSDEPWLEDGSEDDEESNDDA